MCSLIGSIQTLHIIETPRSSHMLANEAIYHQSTFLTKKKFIKTVDIFFLFDKKKTQYSYAIFFLQEGMASPFQFNIQI